MKYIKLFEETEDTITYWKVKTFEPYLLLSLIKIGASIENFKYLFNPPLGTKAEDISYPKYIIIKRYDNIEYSYWDWDNLTSNIGLKSIYMGEVEITYEDIEKWETEQAAKKYNL